MIFKTQTEDSFKRESWHKYTLGGRVTLRDGVLQDGEIQLAPGQGMLLDYEHTKIKQQTTLNKEGHEEVRVLDYEEGTNFLELITTTKMSPEAKKILTKTKRLHDAYLRLSGIHQTEEDYQEDKFTNTVDFFGYEDNSVQAHRESTRKLNHPNAEDVDAFSSEHSILAQAKSGRIL